jgi:hypothetical protein
MRNQRSFEQLLEHCLQKAIHTQDVEAVLRHYPQEASQLRPLLEIALATGSHYADVPEPPGGLAAGRQQLLELAARQRKRDRITNNSIPRKERIPKMKLAFAAKLISAVLAVVIGTAAIGGGTTLAASESLPGDALYPAKLFIEDIRLQISSTPETHVNLGLQFADERLAEIEELANTGQLVPKEVAARMTMLLNQTMIQAAHAPEEEMSGLLKQIAQHTQTQAQMMEQLQAQVQGQNQIRLANALQICRQAHEEALAGLSEPQIFRTRYQHRTGMPEDITPPEPSTSGPGGPKEQEEETPQAVPENELPEESDADEPHQDQDRDRQQDQSHDENQNQDRDRQQEQSHEEGQNQDQNHQQEQPHDESQSQDRDRQHDQSRDGNQTQDRDRLQEQPHDEDQDQNQQQNQSGSEGTNSTPASSTSSGGSEESGKGNGQ